MVTDGVHWTYAVVGLDEMMRALDEVSAPIATNSALDLNRLAEAAFALTQERVHVITGVLKASGRLQVIEDDYTWEMKITYEAYRKTFNYAYYEMMRHGVKPGHGLHDYYAGLDKLVDRAIETVMNEHFEPMNGV